LQISFSLYGEV